MDHNSSPSTPRPVIARPLPQQSKVLAVHRETPDAVTIRLGTPLHHKPGQFLMTGVVLAELGPREIRRSYSIASHANGSWVEITIKAQEPGLFSQYAQHLAVGDELTVYGPFGHHFILDPTALTAHDHIVFLAGGSGIAPFRAMILAAIEAKSQAKFTLIHSVKTPQDSIYHAEFAAWQRSLNLTVVVTVTRPTEHDQQTWSGRFGRITNKTLHDVLGESLASSRYFVCGPTAMVQDAQLLLEKAGVPKEHVKCEKFGAIEG